jgi:hypothetical protein
MSSKPLEVRVPITELPMLVEKKSKQTDLKDTPEPMSLPINNLSYSRVHIYQDESWLFSGVHQCRDLITGYCMGSRTKSVFQLFS